MALRLYFATSILVFLTLTSSIYLNLKPVSAVPGVSPPDPLNVWAPYGPMVKNLQLHYYSDPSTEYNDFIAGHLDLTDSPLPATPYASIDNNPDLTLSPLQGGFTVFGIFFNGASSRFTASKESPTSPANGPYWGCDWNTGTQFTSTEQTYVSQCGINMRQAFAHLIDRTRFAANNRGRMGEALLPLADPSPLAKDPSGSSRTTQCTWDPLYPSTQYPTCLGAYHFGDNPNGFAVPSSPDFCAAADHMIMAGIATGKQPGTCVLIGVNPGVFAYPLRVIQRGTSGARHNLANGFNAALNQLFGGPAVIQCIGQFCSSPYFVFTDPPITPIDDWDAYTYGYIEQGPYPDQLSSLYTSQFATNYCGGIQNGSPSNPTFVCNPSLDQHIKAAAQAIDQSTFRAETLSAFNAFGSNAIDIPVYTEGVRTPALRSVAGLVNGLGVGFPNFYTILNARKDPNYTPVNSIYQFGGGDPTTLRYGQADPTTFLNIFNVQTAWEFNTISEIYDMLLRASPVQPGSIFCWMCNTFTQSIDSKGNEHFLVELRQNLRWQDGTIVDAKDVAFSLLSLRDLSFAGYGLLGTLQSVNVLSNTTLEIVFKGQSINYPVFLESYIVPRHLWQCDLVQENDCAAGAAAVMAVGSSVSDYTNAGVNVPSAARIDPSYDPLATGTLIGSGPFLCRSIFPEDIGKIGTGCMQNSDGSRSGQSADVGGTMHLQTFDRTGELGNTDPLLQYMRSYNTSWGTGSGTPSESGQFQEFSYADKDKDGIVDAVDLASAAACFGASPSNNYNNGNCGLANYNYYHRAAFDSGTISSTEVSIVAAHYGDTYVSPYSWNPPTLQNIVPYP